MIVQEISLDELKTALRLEGKTVTDWAEELRNPPGISVDRTNIYKHNSPVCLINEIKSVISASKKRYPEYRKAHSKRDSQ